MRLATYIVNAFSERIGCGNPAGVVLCDGSLDAPLMQAIALDIGKSETAFVAPCDGPDSRRIRWFSPLKEMPLCGHATLAAAKVLFAADRSVSRIRFAYAGDEIEATRTGDQYIAMSFPLDEWRPTEVLGEYLDFFGLRSARECIIGVGTKKVIVVVDDEVELRLISPDFRRMKAFDGPCVQGIGITKRSRSYDFESRYFNPWAGVDEDPVTGSVHTVLARYWSERLGKDRLVAFQDSQRPGELLLAVAEDRVEIQGKARIVFEGYIEV